MENANLHIYEQIKYKFQAKLLMKFKLKQLPYFIWLRPNWFRCLHLDDIFYFYLWTTGLALWNTWNFKEWELDLLTICWLADFEKNHSCLVLFMFGNKTQVWLWPILNTGIGRGSFGLLEDLISYETDPAVVAWW